METKSEKSQSQDVASQPRAAMIVAMGEANEIGRGGGMPWHIPEDLRHFKQLTTGHPVIMGRATWESLPRRPLPGRLNIIISAHHRGEDSDCVKWVSSPAEALKACSEGSEPFVIGGGRIYREMMDFAERLEITRVEATFPDADTFFPTIDPLLWQCVSISPPLTSSSGLIYRFKTYERRHNQ